MYKNSKYIYGLLKHFPDKFQRICCSCCCWSRNCDSIFCLRKGFMYKSHANLYHLFSLKSLYAFGSDLFASNQQEWNGIVSMKYIFSKQDNGENEKELLFRSLYSRYIFCVWEEKWYLEWKEWYHDFDSEEKEEKENEYANCKPFPIRVWTQFYSDGVLSTCLSLPRMIIIMSMSTWMNRCTKWIDRDQGLIISWILND